MLAVYELGTGETRQELHRRIAGIFTAEENCPTRRIDAFCKLLDDESEYARDPKGEAAQLRKKVFSLAAPNHPLVCEADRLFDRTEKEVKKEIANFLNMSWPEIKKRIFADVIEFHRLKAFHGYPSPKALLSRYNVAQVQAALYRATNMIIWARQDFKTILRHAKLARLMHSIKRIKPGYYQITLDGPASLIRQSRRYGVAMAKFLPKLLACQGWEMRAELITPRRGHRVSLKLSSNDGLKSHLPAPDIFDSGLEEVFAKKWGKGPRQGWTLIREGDILHKGQKVFVPDFVFEHEKGHRAPLELVGFWTDDYLRNKVRTLQAFREHHIILAVGEAGKKRISGLPAETIFYKSALKIKDVLDRLEALVA
jgi:hypothetical protein